MTTEGILKNIEDKISSGEIRKNDFEEGIRAIKNQYRKLQELLEWATEAAPKEEKNKIYQLYRRISFENSSDLIDRLNVYGYTLINTSKIVEDDKKREELKKTFKERQGYRLMELTRLGKRDEVFYMLLRIFWSFQIRFPKILCEPFKPVYSDELFKALILSFLSGILKEQKQ